MTTAAPDARRAECDAHWRRQRDTLAAALDQAVPPGRPVAYLDYPVHRNLGDLLIYLGTWSWLRGGAWPGGGRARRVVGCWNKDNFPRPALAEGTVVLLHGGGNFGDLYPGHQRFRESVVAAYPDHRVVVLPQSIRFEDAAAQAASAAVLNGHRDLHLLVRDPDSLAVARSDFAGAASALVPDMATFLYPIPHGVEATTAGGDLHLLRRDREAAGGEDPAAGQDWTDLLGPLGWRLRALQAANAALGRHLPAAAFERAWRRGAGAAMDRAVAAFRGADRVVTSRLHGHILASLLGVPHVLRDNSYGKNSRYFRAWSADLSFARMDEDLKEG